VTGILCQGSNGEAQHLTHEERSEVIRFTRRTLDDNGFQNTLVIAGTGGQSTRETKKLNEDAKAAGASHALILTPATWKPVLTKELIVRFHREVRAFDFPCPSWQQAEADPAGRRCIADPDDGLQLLCRDCRTRPRFGHDRGRRHTS
jgi:hypothetical protein